MKTYIRHWKHCNLFLEIKIFLFNRDKFRIKEKCMVRYEGVCDRVSVIDWIKSINNSFRRHLKTSTKRFYLYFTFSLISFKFKCRNFHWHLYRMCGWQHVIQHVENSIFKIRTYWMLWHCSFSNLFNTFVFLFSFILFLKCAPERKKT